MGKITPALKWLEKNGPKLGKRYKNQWLAIGADGVKAHSVSYANVAKASEGGNYVVVRVPKNPNAAFFY